MRTLNLGILAHVDAGKTSLTERLLFHAGVIGHLGSVDAGSTRTDTLDIERRRGITIKSAVATFDVGDLTVNVIDTPGHPDFVAEVERALKVLDGAILVISAVEGIQAQTRFILRALQRMRVPTLLFINKVDRVGADADAVVKRIQAAAPMWADPREILADIDAEILDAYVHDRPLPEGALARLVTEVRAFPAYRGSAITGEGIAELVTAITDLLPSATGDPSGDLEAVVFALERDRSAWVRVHTGTLRPRDKVGDERVTEIGHTTTGMITAGQIGRIRGLKPVRVGDVLGHDRLMTPAFAPPTLVATVTPVDPLRRNDLHLALQRLAEQDPLINLRMDDLRHELSVSLYGEVQKEVLRDTLADEYGIDARFGEAKMLLRERPAGVGHASAAIGQHGNRHLAALDLRIQPSDGRMTEVTAPLDDIPLHIYGTVAAFREAMDRHISDVLVRKGGPRGWEVSDIAVTVAGCAYNSPGSRSGDFRRLAQELISVALIDAGTILCEPLQRVHVEGPAASLSPVLSALHTLNASLEESRATPSTFSVVAHIAAGRVITLERALPELTHGEGILDAQPSGWRPIQSG